MNMRQHKRRYSGRFYMLSGYWKERFYPVLFGLVDRPYDRCNPRAYGV